MRTSLPWDAGTLVRIVAWGLREIHGFRIDGKKSAKVLLWRTKSTEPVRRITMPLVRIDLRKGKAEHYRKEIGRVVYDALRSVGVPENDRFQLINEHEAGTFYYDADYLGIHRTDDLVIIQITWNEGRTIEQKKVLYNAIASGLSTALSIRPEDVLINLVEVKKENWSFGHGIAQYVS
jgi:phenylpyruvate tautomerase PptA (4-oxalocrotonate tautomerase family)